MSVFYITFRTTAGRFVVVQAAEFDNLAQAEERLALYIRQALETVQDEDEWAILCMQCEICNEKGNVLATLRFRDLVAFH